MTSDASQTECIFDRASPFFPASRLSARYLEHENVDSIYAYIVFSPVRDVDERTGGALWDARADGTVIASMGLVGVDPKLLGPAADQSVLPFMNPLEDNTTDLDVCRHVAAALYASL